MANIVNFHLPADNVARATEFYRAVFGWEFSAQPNSPNYQVAEAHDGPGIAAAITERSATVKAPVPTIEVEDIDNAMVQIAMRGGQQAHVQTIPGIGRFGYAIDSEGTIIALLQREAAPPG